VRILIGGILGVALVAVAGLAAVYAGAYNVAATQPHSDFGRWLFGTTMENSVRRHAAGIAVPDGLDGGAVEEGFRHYTDNCAGCHGAPGVEPGEVGRGLTPEPPDLQQAAERWSLAELYWIIRNGIKMTGMPAWAPSHTDEQIWQLAAFVQALPRIGPADYQEMQQRLGGAHGGDGGAHGHEHDHGDHGH